MATVSRPADTPRARLVELLRQTPRGKPVLGALEPETRARLDALLEGLSEPERELLRAHDSPIARERPLLHLMAGGRSRAAYLALATTAAAARELSQGVTEPAGLGRVLETTNEVIRRAALEWLELAQEHLESESDVDVGFCDALDRVAGTLDRLELRLAARALWVELEDSPAARLNLARAALWNGDRQAAREQHGRAVAQGPLDAKLKLFASQIDELIERAQRTDTVPQTIDEAVEHARTYLALRDLGAARRVLEPHAAAAEEHLGLATMLVVTAHPRLPCPGVTGGLGDGRLCAYSLGQTVFRSPEFTKLEPAWQSGRGRTTGSVQDYLGLAVVLPWQSQALASASAPDMPERARRLAELSAEAAALSPEFSGLEVFSRALATGAEAARAAAPGAPATPPESARLELVAAARKLGLEGQSALRTAAVLSVVLVLAQHQDVRELYSKLAPQQDLDRENSRLAIGAWLAAAWGDAELFETVKADAITLLTEFDGGSLASSTLVLLLAEAATLIDPTPENRQALTQVTEQLSDPGVPVELRLRAALTRAALVEGSEGAASAARQLEQVLAAPAPPTTHDTGHELYLIARARHLLLSEPGDASQRLADFREIFGDRRYPPNIEVWRRSWELELEHRARAEACGKRAACVKQAAQQRDKLLASALATAPSVASRLHGKGALTLGELQMNIDYEPGAGLMAIVRTEPMLVFLPLPAGAHAPRD